jgi:hypothetical protein
MPDMSAIAAALASFNTLKNIAQTMIGLHDTQALQLKVIEFNSAIIDAQGKIFSVNEERSTLIERVRDLEQQITNLKNWETEKQRYELKQVAYLGSAAYVIKPEMRGTEPPHCICAACYEHGKKRILQPTQEEHLRNRSWKCPDCKNTVIVSLPLPGYTIQGSAAT